MIIYKTSNEDLYKEVLEDRERLHKEAEEALKANKENAEEIEKYHGADTKKPITNKALKAMHLSEALFENLNDDEVRNFNEDVYDAIARICELYTYDGVSDEDVQNAIKYFLDNYKNDENINYYLSWKKIEEPEEIPEFEGTWDKLNELTDLGESLNETLKVKMTPEEHECVNKLIRKPYYEIIDVLSSYELNDVKISRNALEFAFNYMLNKLRPLDESLNESTFTANIYLVQGMFNQAKDLGLEKEAVDILYDRGIGITKDGTCIELPKSACTGAYIDLRNLIDGLNESLTEELSQQGQKVLNELKKELGPELQKKVAFVIKDYANTTPSSDSDMDKKEKEIMKESIQYAIAKEQLEKYNEGRMPEAWNPKTYLEKLVMKSHITEEQAQMLKENYIHE